MNKNYFQALRYLYVNGCMYKNDFYMLLGKRASTKYSRMNSKKPLVEERQIPTQGTKRNQGDMSTIVDITRYGKDEYLDIEDQELYINSEGDRKIFTSIDLNHKVYPQLNRSKASILYYATGVKTLSCEKPSLSYLFANWNNGYEQGSGKVVKTYIDSYLETLETSSRKEWILELLNRGAYYSKSEVLDFFKDQGDDFADSTKGVKWDGLFFNKTNCFINTILPYGDNNRCTVEYNQTKRLMWKLRSTIGKMLDLNRTLYDFNDYLLTQKYNDKYETDIDAVTIGIGDAHVYAEAMGNKRGHIKNTDMSLMNQAKEFGNSSKKEMDLLDKTSHIFKRIYAVSTKQLGINMLSYITTRSLEDYKREEIELFKSDIRFTLIDNYKESLYPATLKINDNTTIETIYLPVYEAKLLAKISEHASLNGVCVCCKKEMFETVAHAIHADDLKSGRDNSRLAPLYFVEVVEADDKSLSLGNIYDESSGHFSIYNSDGYIKGQKVLDEYFKKKYNARLKTKGEYTKLAKLCQRMATDEPSKKILTNFLNRIAVSDDKSLEVILAKAKGKYGIDTEDKKYEIKLVEIAEKEKKYRKRHKRIQTFFLNESYTQIKELSKASGDSLASVVAKETYTMLEAVQAIADKTNAPLDKSYETYRKIVEQALNKALGKKS